MGRPTLPEVEKLKSRIVDLTDDEANVLFAWFEMLLEVREADRKRSQKGPNGLGTGAV